MRILGNQFRFRETVITAFTDGDCWALAVYLHEQTGWDIVALGLSVEETVNPEYRYWEHMAVRMPDGRILDVTGAWDEDELLGVYAEWGHCYFEANDPGYRIECKRQFRHNVATYGSEILEALGVCSIAA